MKVKETWIVTVANSIRTVYITKQGLYFMTTTGDDGFLVSGALEQISEDQFKDLIKNIN